MSSPVDFAIAVRADGMSVLLDVRAGQLPAVVHWGPDLGELSDADAEALMLTGVAPVGPNVVDEPVRVALLPEHWTGWVGRPGISGSRSGAAWSPKFTTVAVRIAGQPAVGPEEGRLIHVDGPVAVEVDAADESAQLAVTVRFDVLARRADPCSGRVDQSRRRLPVERLRAGLPGAARCSRDPRYGRALGQGADPAAPAADSRHSPAGGAQRPHRAGRGHPASSRDAGVRLRHRRDLGRAHRLERESHPLRRAALHRRAGHRRR